jgi:hypothetical protein
MPHAAVHATDPSTATLTLYFDGVAKGSSILAQAEFDHGDDSPFSIFRRAGSPSNPGQFAEDTETLTGTNNNVTHLHSTPDMPTR